MKRNPFLPLVAVLVPAAGVGLLWPATAQAHFILSSPMSWANQGNLGDPQKSAPCGQADPGTAAVPTGMVTPFHPGDTISITIKETITHPGHYRVALALTQNELPADPQVTAGSTACGSAAIQNPPIFPVLADGVLEHTSAFSGPQTFTVKLPDGMTCTKCTLQVEEFMSDHPLNNPGGCCYHHCADISIQAAGGGDAATTGDAAQMPIDHVGNDSGGGCGCAVGRPASALGALLLALPLLIWSRRHRRAR
jgi:hypothetical protein